MRMVPGLQVLSYTAEGGIKVEGLVVWTFSDTANLVYAANLSGSWMAGVQGYETAEEAKTAKAASVVAGLEWRLLKCPRQRSGATPSLVVNRLSLDDHSLDRSRSATFPGRGTHM